MVFTHYTEIIIKIITHKYTDGSAWFVLCNMYCLYLQFLRRTQLDVSKLSILRAIYNSFQHGNFPNPSVSKRGVE